MRKPMIVAAVLLSLAGLAACQPEDEPLPPGVTTLSDAERADCQARGGSLSMSPMAQTEICVRPTADAGKACNKAQDCSAGCLADTRTCAKVTPMFGCNEFLNETGQKVGMCVD